MRFVEMVPVLSENAAAIIHQPGYNVFRWGNGALSIDVL